MADEKTKLDEKDIYHAPTVQIPTKEKLRDIANKLGIDATEQDVCEYQDEMVNLAAAYQAVGDYPAPSLPVKYPRTPGYRPTKSENPYNAWYYKTDIKGASSGILSGKKVAIKDNIAVAGVPMMCGSHLMDGYMPEFDATVVTRILDAGGQVLGKATCEDLCFSGTSSTSVIGPVLNPIYPMRTAGGSSSGSGALVASGEVDMALGTDQGGSVRYPALCCSIVGLKPTFGLVPYTGAMGLSPMLDHIGPITRNVKDCALLLEAISGYDSGLDVRQHPGVEVKKYSQLLSENISNIKIGIVQEGFPYSKYPEIASMVEESANQLDKKGAILKKISIPIHAIGGSLTLPAFFEGMHHHVIQQSGAGIGCGGFAPTSACSFLQKGIKQNLNDVSHKVKLLSLWGSYVHEAYGTKFYNKSVNLVQTMREEYNKALQDVDVLVMPTMPGPILDQPPKEATSVASSFKHTIGRFCEIDNLGPFNFTGHPAISVPAGVVDGKPVGMMIVGRHYDETTVLNVAYASELLKGGK